MDSPAEQTEQQAEPAPPAQPEERRFDPAEVMAVTGMIAERLDEPEVEMIRRVVAYVGPEAALDLLAETMRVEANGGLLINDGSRRRSPGGVFFTLLRNRCQMSRRTYRRLLPHPAQIAWWEEHRKEYIKARQSEVQEEGQDKKRRQRKRYQELTPSTAAIADAVWARRAQLVSELVASRQIGVGTSMKAVLVGQPGNISKQNGFVMIMMRGASKIPALPKGLPPIPAPNSLTYIVYIPDKQWKKVEQSLRNPKALLIIEGFVTFDSSLKKMCLFCQSATTNLIQQAIRATQDRDQQTKI